jgi:aconitate hydratase
LKIEVGLIGSCTNSSYEDIARAAIAKQVTDKKLKLKSEFTITQVLKWFDIQSSVTVLLILSKIGATVFANACGPCIGMWDREVLKRRTKHNRSLVQP